MTYKERIKREMIRYFIPNEYIRRGTTQKEIEERKKVRTIKMMSKVLKIKEVC